MTKPMLKAWNEKASAGDNAWLPLLAGMLDEMWDVAAPEEAAAFLHAVGARMAGANPLDDLRSNDEILGAINAFWADLGWGAVDLAFAEDGLRLHHVDLPPAPAAIPIRRWNDSVAAVLAGAYDRWLAALGGAATMRTRLVTIRGSEAEFHYA